MWCQYVAGRLGKYAVGFRLLHIGLRLLDVGWKILGRNLNP